jgi:hypothetical protein
MDFKDCLYSLFQTLRECDQLLMPSETVLAPFSLVKSPQGLTNQRFSSLRALADKLNPLDRYVSVIIDEMLLTPRLVFDSNGMIIGHAVNDTVASSGEIESIASAGTPNDALANRMICYMAQGIAQNFHQVSIFLIIMVKRSTHHASFECILNNSSVCVYIFIKHYFFDNYFSEKIEKIILQLYYFLKFEFNVLIVIF